MLETILAALTLGFSTGASCLAACSPFFVPYLLAEERKLKSGFWGFLIFMVGRVTGYLTFGALFGYLGQKINYGWINTASIVGLGILALFMILYSLNLFKLEICWQQFSLKIKKSRLPFWIGLLSGVHPCPAFLLSLNYVFVLGTVIKGLIFFFFFFLATNVYFVPLVFLGQLSRLKEFQTAARFASLLVGIIFFFYAVYCLIFNQNLSLFYE